MSQVRRALHRAQTFQARRISCVLEGRLRLGGPGERRRAGSARGSIRGRARQIVNFRQRDTPAVSPSSAADNPSKRSMDTTNTIAVSTEKFLHYLRYVRNASPKTIISYKIDLDQFIAYVDRKSTRLN